MHLAYYNTFLNSVQLLSRVRLFATPWIAARQASLSITNSRSSPKLMSIELVMPSNHLILFVPFSSCPQSFPTSWSFPIGQFFASLLELQLQHQSFQWILGLISFRMDWLDHLAIQGALKSLLQHHSSKHHFFSTQLSLWSNSHIYTRLLKKPKALTDGLDITRKSNVSAF